MDSWLGRKMLKCLQGSSQVTALVLNTGKLCKRTVLLLFVVIQFQHINIARLRLFRNSSFAPFFFHG